MTELHTLPAYPSMRFCVVEDEDPRLEGGANHAYAGDLAFRDDGVVLITRWLFELLKMDTGLVPLMQ